MAKIELTLTIDGVNQDIPVPDGKDLTIPDIYSTAGAIISVLSELIEDQGDLPPLKLTEPMELIEEPTEEFTQEEDID